MCNHDRGSVSVSRTAPYYISMARDRDDRDTENERHEVRKRGGLLRDSSMNVGKDERG